MKQILVISDTHGFIDPRLKSYIDTCDEIWHAGDFGPDVLENLPSKKLKGVFGNIDDRDVRITFPEKNCFSCEGLKVMMTHIGGHPGKYARGVKESLEEQKPDVFITGHSHILKIMRDPRYGLLYINPGAAGNHGFHLVKTAVWIQVANGNIGQIDVIELGRRGQIV